MYSATSRSHPVLQFLIVGGATWLLYPLFWLLREVLGLSSAELIVGFLTFHGAHVINDPHFAATYLLFYKNVRQKALGNSLAPSQRLRYWGAGALVPLLLVTWASIAIAVASPVALGAMMQLMFLLVGWHYVKQGYGVLVVLSAQKKFYFEPAERRALLFHCYAGWAYAWANPRDTGRLLEEKGVVFESLRHPPGLEEFTLVVFAVSVGALAWVALRRLRAGGPFPPLAALLGLVVTVWFWTVFSNLDPLMVYAIPALHSIQYLYFVSLLERNRARQRESAPHFGPPVPAHLLRIAAGAIGLGWLLFHALPYALDHVIAPSLYDAVLGRTPYFAAVFAIVNIHHYFMDSVIWRRENPETRYLS